MTAFYSCLEGVEMLQIADYDPAARYVRVLLKRTNYSQMVSM